MGVSLELGDDAAALELETAKFVPEGDPTSTVEDGKILIVGMVLLSMRVNDRDIEVELGPATDETSLLLDRVAVDDESEALSVVKNVVKC